MGAFLASPDGRLLHVNRRWCDLTGQAPEQAAGHGWLDALHPDDRAQVQAAWRHCGLWALPVSLEYRLLRSDGAPAWVVCQAQVETCGRGAALTYVGTLTEVSRQKQSELEQARLRDVLDASVDEIYVFDGETLRFRYVNAGAANNLKYAPQALLGMTPLDIKPEFDRDSFQALLEPLRRGELALQVFHTVHRRADGSLYPVEVRLQHFEHAGERIFLAVILDVTARRETERALRVAERCIATSINAIMLADLDGRLTYVNQAYLDLWGYSQAEALGRAGPASWADAQEAARLLAVVRTQGSWTGELVALRRDGTTFTAQVSAHLVTDAKGQPLCLMGSCVDVSARKAAEADRDKLSSALHHTADMILITDRQGVIEYINPAFELTTGFQRHELLGCKPSLLKSGHHDAAFYAGMWAAILRGEVFRDVLVNKRKDGSFFYEQKTITPLTAADGAITHFVAIGTDITERMQVQKRLQHLAHHDALTDLPNRFLFAERLEHAIAASRRSRRTLAVLFLDLDRFKLINDSLGHPAGDAALRMVAARLRACLRAADTVARLGGDEFAVLLEDVATVDDVVPVASKLLRALAEPLNVQGRELVLTASLGIALHPADGNDAEQVLRNADAAMYRAKDDGRNGYVFYSRHLEAAALERLVLESSLRRALARDELVLHYQPQVALDGGDVVCVEALLRWHRPDGELLSAQSFVALAEETGLITEIDEWVLRAATRQLKEWQGVPGAPARVAINLSGRSLRKAAFTQSLADLVRGAEVDPGAIEFELTEGVVMTDAEITTGILAELGRLGCRLAIDDFGTGYSSLSYLKRFPIRVLKIDRSFVRDLPGDKDDAAIVHTIMAMARSLRLEVVAEGVETPAQLDFLRACGCTRIQGHVFSAALDAGALLELVRGGARLPGPQS